jgi:hypothetical protein
MQIIKGLSSYILFRLCPDFRKRYPKWEFWNDGYFCVSCESNFDRALRYIENQEQHHLLKQFQKQENYFSNSNNYPRKQLFIFSQLNQCIYQQQQ